MLKKPHEIFLTRFASLYTLAIASILTYSSAGVISPLGETVFSLRVGVCVLGLAAPLGAASTQTLPNCGMWIRHPKISCTGTLPHFFGNVQITLAMFVFLFRPFAHMRRTGNSESRTETEYNTETCLLHGGLWQCRAQCHAQKWPERRRCYYRWALIIFTFYIRVYDEYLSRKLRQ